MARQAPYDELDCLHCSLPLCDESHPGCLYQIAKPKRTVAAPKPEVDEATARRRAQYRKYAEKRRSRREMVMDAVKEMRAT